VFLMQELRMELSLEKTLVTAAEDGIDFLGYRFVQTTLCTRPLVGNLCITKKRLQRHGICLFRLAGGSCNVTADVT
jgi:RNA-directed DNA polymerase